MKHKYETNNYAIYNGNLYQAGINKDGTLFLNTYEKPDPYDNFILYNYTDRNGNFFYTKDVLPLDVTEFYKESYFAKYRGIPVYIWAERSEDDKIMITPVGNTKTFKELWKEGFKEVDRGMAGKLVSENDLENIHSVKDDLLKNAKANYLQDHPEKE